MHGFVFFFSYGSNILRNTGVYNELIPFASNFIVLGLYYKKWINKPPFTFFEVDSAFLPRIQKYAIGCLKPWTCWSVQVHYSLGS